MLGNFMSCLSSISIEDGKLLEKSYRSVCLVRSIVALVCFVWIVLALHQWFKTDSEIQAYITGSREGYLTEEGILYIDSEVETIPLRELDIRGQVGDKFTVIVNNDGKVMNVEPYWDRSHDEADAMRVLLNNFVQLLGVVIVMLIVEYLTYGYNWHKCLQWCKVGGNEALKLRRSR